MAPLSILRGGASTALLEPDARSTSTAALEASLARKAAAGDAPAQRRALEIAGPSMLRVVRTVLGTTAAEAEDVTQEALIAFVDALGSFRGDCGLRHYGCRIAARMAVRFRRRDRGRRARRQESALEQQVLAEGPTVAATAVAASRRKALLRELLDDIPEEQAESLVLRVVLGYSLADVAAAAHHRTMTRSR